MKSFNVYKYFILSFLIVVGCFSLYMSQQRLTFNKSIFAYTTAQSSTSTDKANFKNVSNDMYELLAHAIFAEARGESYLGQVAVGAVIMNRVKSPSFPNTIAGVIYQSGQFSSVADGQINMTITDEYKSVYQAARDALNGSDPTGGALYFYNPKTAKSKWLFSLETVATIGNHVFAKGE